MITQKPICFKIDTMSLENLDKLVSRTWRKRNWHINQAIRIYLSLKNVREFCRSNDSEETKKAAINRWLKDQFPEAAKW